MSDGVVGSHHAAVLETLMARARNIKPGFFKNAELVELTMEVRLLFIGLWTLADRAGRLEDRPKQIRMELFPADSVDVDAGLDCLQRAGFVIRYEADGMQVLQVLNFLKHQNPHRDEKASALPEYDAATMRAPCKHSASTVQAPCKDDASTLVHGLIPDSGFLIPDSLTTIPSGMVPARRSTNGHRHPSVETSPKTYKPPDCPHKAVLELWSEVLPAMPQHDPAMWNGTRADHLRVRWRETAAVKGWPNQAAGLQYLRKLFGYVGQSEFLTGRAKPRDGKRPFFIELEWLVAPVNWARVHEGRYHEGGTE